MKFVFAVSLSALLCGRALAGSIVYELDSALTIEAIQPPAALIERIEHRIPDDGRESTAPLIDGHLPYYLYRSLQDESLRVIHPMRLGRFLGDQAGAEEVRDILDAALDIAFELPNGGLAWYYPRHYKVNRMTGENLKYSAISQGTLIAGLGAIAKQNDDIDDRYARRAFDALLWPYEKGGVNFDDRAILEMPSFAGPPENILNGWIDALLHVRDFAELYNDDKALRVFRSNIAFLVDVLPNFDDREAGLSRYSDLSPYRARVTLARPDDVDTMEVLYRPRIDGLPSIRVPLERVSDPDNFSIYDNSILRQNGRTAFVWLSCSQIFETVLIARSDYMVAEIDSGTLNRRQSTPGYGGTIIDFESQADGDLRQIAFTAEDGLICGYPTNFSHDEGMNPYHVYHVVGLLLLALGDHVTDEQRSILIEWALRWHDDVERISHDEGLAFRDPDEWLRLIRNSQLKPDYRSFSELKRKASQL